MARGYYHEDDEGDRRPPSRPTRRTDSHRRPQPRNGGEVNRGYSGGHYAESPIVVPPGEQRTLALVSRDESRLPPAAPSHRSSTLPASRRSRSNSRPRPPGGVTTVSKVSLIKCLFNRFEEFPRIYAFRWLVPARLPAVLPASTCSTRPAVTPGAREAPWTSIPSSTTAGLRQDLLPE